MNEVDGGRISTVVAIASSNYLLRLGLQRIVENEPWIRLIGHAVHVVALDDMLIREQPHIMIVDTEISSDVTGLIQKIKMTAPRTRIILLCGLQDPECTRQAIDFGVDGIVLKMQPSAVLIATIEYFARPFGALLQPIGDGAAQLTMSNAPNVQPLLTGNPSLPKWSDGLTEREREVVRLISEGLSNKDIADRLCISSITVRHHLTSIFDKLGVSNRQKLLIRAHQQGLAGSPALA